MAVVSPSKAAIMFSNLIDMEDGLINTVITTVKMVRQTKPLPKVNPVPKRVSAINWAMTCMTSIKSSTVLRRISILTNKNNRT